VAHHIAYIDLKLTVVIVCLARNRESLAIGNVVGSAICNILGSFSLGLLCYCKGEPIQFDRSSRTYSLLLLVLTTVVTPVTFFSKKIIWLTCGSILIITFFIYLGSIGWAIRKGILHPPEKSEDEGSGDERSDRASGVENPEGPVTEEQPLLSTHVESLPEYLAPRRSTGHAGSISDDEATSSQPQTPRRPRQTLKYHVLYLALGFLAICLAGYVISHAATNITDEFGISDVLFGIVILAIATTLPEKFVAVISGYRSHAGILVANTAGSNVFLLTLCSGIIMVDTSGKFDKGSVKLPELCVLWGSKLALGLDACFHVDCLVWRKFS
jgi:Ca2+/Na+ antiporter